MPKKTSKKSEEQSEEKLSEKKDSQIEKKVAKSSSDSKDASTVSTPTSTSNTIKSVEGAFPGVNFDENLAKLTTPADMEKMAKNLDEVVDTLKKLGISDMDVNRQKLLITIPFEYENVQFMSHVVIAPEWALIKTSLLELDGLTQDGIFEVFFEILKGNFILNNVVYSVDPEGKSIWAECDIHLPSDIKTFEMHYFSTIFAIDYFLKNISTKINRPAKPSKQLPPLAADFKNLYI